MVVILIRDKGQENPDQGLWGGIYIIENKIVLYNCQTIELPWRDNKPNISCFSFGEFSLAWTYSPVFKRFMYLIVENDPTRDGLRLHSGNYAGDKALGFQSHSLGCPLLGRKRGYLDNQKAVLISRPAVSDFERILAGRTVKFIIKEA